MNQHIHEARLVWDGGDTVYVPPKMGAPTPDQLTGTPGEQLCELACRVCYDSLGLGFNGKPKGRSTGATLANVLDVQHHSVVEHFSQTIEILLPTDELSGTYRIVPGLHWLRDVNRHVEALIVLAFTGRPGAHIRLVGTPQDDRFGPNKTALRVTVNVRAVLEWERWSAALLREQGLGEVASVVRLWHYLGVKLARAMHPRVPLLVEKPAPVATGDSWLLASPTRVVAPETDAERHVSIYMVGSRGFGNELVRHRYNISQRSTRYCDEAESPWHLHPLVGLYRQARPKDVEMAETIEAAIDMSKSAYAKLVVRLKGWLMETLPPDTPYRAKHALKQARGAARGLLGNALETQVVFTAPVWAWRHIIRMRAAEAADAEIRVIAAAALPELKRSRYADRFQDLELEPAGDGMGECLKGGGHA